MSNKSVLKPILRLCVPLYLSGLFTTGYNIADTVTVGKFLGKSALAGLGNAATLMFLMQGLMLGLCSGLCSLISKSIGKNDKMAARQGAACSLLLTLFLSAAAAALVFALLPKILSLLNTQQEFYDYTVKYLRITVLGFPVLSVYRLLEAWLNALCKNYVTMWLCVLSLTLHLVLNFLLIKPFGIAGVALTSVISFAVCAAVAYLYIIKKHSALSLRPRDFKGCLLVIAGQFKASVPMSVMQLSKGVGLVMLQGACNAQGASVSAAFAVCSKLMHLSTDGATALSNSSVAFFSQNHNDSKRIKRGMRTSIIIGACFSLLSGGVLIFVSGPLSRLFLAGDSTEVVSLVKQFFLYIAPFFAVLSVAVILRSALLSRAHPYLAMTEGVSELAARAAAAFAAIKINKFWIIPLCFGASWTVGLVVMILIYIPASRGFLMSNR